jgi:hypothetical protein
MTILRSRQAGQAASEGKTAEAADLPRSALALWCGPVLAGLAGRGTPELLAESNQIK